MEIHVKAFADMTPLELYKCMKLRVDVFVCEQECLAPELDDRDQDAVHVWIEENGRVEAYLRVLDRGVESEYVALGRVVTRKATRGKGYGAIVMQEGIRVAREQFQADRIYLEAQTYAEGFYMKQGFHRISEEFNLDGMPHYKMLWEEKENVT